MGLFTSLAKAAAKVGVGSFIRKGLKSGVEVVSKGVKRLSGKNIAKGIKRVGQSGERVVGGLTNVAKRLNPVVLIRTGRQFGFKTLADRMGPILRNAYHAGSNTVAKGQAVKELSKIAKLTKNVRNLNQLDDVLIKLKGNKLADSSILTKLITGAKNLMSRASNAGVNTAKSTALDYVIGEGVTKLGTAAMGMGTIAGGTALGVELSK